MLRLNAFQSRSAARALPSGDWRRSAFISLSAKRHFIFVSPTAPSLSMRGVSALSPSIDLPPFMSCLMKRGSKKEICASETRLDRCDVFTSNEAARPRFSGSQAVWLPLIPASWRKTMNTRKMRGRRRVFWSVSGANYKPVIVTNTHCRQKICIQATALDKGEVTVTRSQWFSSGRVISRATDWICSLLKSGETLQEAAGNLRLSERSSWRREKTNVCLRKPFQMYNVFHWYLPSPEQPDGISTSLNQCLSCAHVHT